MITQETINQEIQKSLSRTPSDKPFEVERRIKSSFRGAFYTYNEEMLALLNKIEVLAYMDISCLIYGPSGVGKEAIAYRLHQRRTGEFVTVNCGAIPGELLEAEFFGAQKGSYTGCNRDRAGYFAQANDGTLFLDELGELPLSMQAKLLRTLESRKFRPVGGEREYPITCRIVAATNKDLPSLMNSGKFREDLYFRIAKITLSIPPLTKRIEDAELLFRYYFFKVNCRDATEEDVSRFFQNFNSRVSLYEKGNTRMIISYVINCYIEQILEATTRNQPTHNPQPTK